MSFKKPTANKMMTTPPAMKGFHFASHGVHEAMYVEAATIEEATAIYNKDKKKLAVGGTVSTSATAEPEEKAVQ